MITATHQLKPQWRFERPHRVRFFTESIHINLTTNKNAKDLFWEVAEKFRQTPEYTWVEDNGIDLQYTVDELAQDWHKQVRFYGDLTESQYVDYTLRFFTHGKDWK